MMVRTLIAGMALGCGSSTDDSADHAWPLDPATGLRIPDVEPLGELPEWKDNESTEARIALGLSIYNDRRLSGSGYTTCTACHLSSGFFTSGLEVDIPDRAYPGLAPTLARNTPSLLNLVYTTEFHWDGRPSTINEVWVLPYSEPQMNLTDLPSDDIWNVDEETAQERLYERFTVDVPGYVDWFMEAYSVDIRDLEPVEVWQLTGQAIAVYMRQIVSRNSEFDLWNQGEEVTLDEAAIRGAQLFSGDAGCSYCHSGPLFSDFEYHNLSLLSYDENGEVIDAGRVRVTGDEADEGKFLTPMLRSVLHTSPYFHDGGVFALEDAIRYHFSDDAKLNPLHDPILDVIPDLSDEEVGDLVAFLKSLDGEPIEQKYLTILPDMP